MAGVNLKQIANMAGVSLATASRVLSGSDYPVKEELRKRVLDAAEQLHYVPNAAAQGLLSGQSKTVGVLVGDVADPFSSSLVGGIHEAADEIGYMVTIMNTYRDPEHELAALHRLHAHRVDIMILAGSGLGNQAYQEQITKSLNAYVASGKSAVVIGSHTLPEDMVVSRVELDNRAGGVAMAQHLADLGHEKVALIAGGPELLSIQERVTGFQQVLGDRVTVIPSPPTRDGGYDVAKRLIAEKSDATAIAATADQMAIGALVALREAGISVPEQMSVTGFNDIDIARDLVPALTTMHLPLWEAGRSALQLGHAALTESARSLPLHIDLVERASTAKPRG